jgi:hypothetical protein
VKAFWSALCLLTALGAVHAGAALAATRATPPGLCGGAIEAAQDRHAVPVGLLFAIGEVESGRSDPVTHRLVPWPWTVQAQNQSYYFATEAEAVAWVQAAQARGILSIDVGCMQINLMYHPAAFQNLDAAFDPATNALPGVAPRRDRGLAKGRRPLSFADSRFGYPLCAEGGGGPDREASARHGGGGAQTDDAVDAAGGVGGDA